MLAEGYCCCFAFSYNYARSTIIHLQLISPVRSVFLPHRRQLDRSRPLWLVEQYNLSKIHIIERGL